MTAWHDLTPIQADALRATATLHLRDADELLAELGPLLTAPYSEPAEPLSEASTVVFEANTVAEPADPSWGLLGTTETGFTVAFPSVRLAHSAVKEQLTP